MAYARQKPQTPANMAGMHVYRAFRAMAQLLPILCPMMNHTNTPANPGILPLALSKKICAWLVLLCATKWATMQGQLQLGHVECNSSFIGHSDPCTLLMALAMFAYEICH